MLIVGGNSTATEHASKKKQQASQKSIECEVQSKQIAVEKAEAEEALVAALPALETARGALENLSKKDLSEIKAYTTPPEPVRVSLTITLCF